MTRKNCELSPDDIATNMLSKMNGKTPLGSRIAEVHNGSSLFTGDAGQGESNIRRATMASTQSFSTLKRGSRICSLPPGVAMSTDAPPQTAAQLDLLFAALFEPGDIVELRSFADVGDSLPDGRYVRAGAVTDADHEWLETANSGGRGCFHGVAPRPSVHGFGKGGAAVDTDITLVRSLVADLDGFRNASPEDALLAMTELLHEQNFPYPTAVVWSGGGLHYYARLEEPIAATEFKTLAKTCLIPALNADGNVCNPSRVMRTPGTTNHKPGYTYPLVRILEIDERRRHHPDVFRRRMRPISMPSRSVSGAWQVGVPSWRTKSYLRNGHALKQGCRNDELFRAACDLRGCGWDEDEITKTLGTIALKSGLEQGAVTATLNSAYSQPRDPSRPLTIIGYQDGDTFIVCNRSRPLKEQSADLLDAMEIANIPPKLFMFGGEPVELVDNAGVVRLRPPGLYGMRYHAERAGQCIEVDKKGIGRPVPPPLDLIRDIQAAPTLPFPPLVGFVRSPVFRPDGTLLDQPGYDAQTRLYYSPPPGFTLPAVPERPTADDVARATSRLDDVLGDFPFDSPASKANAVAAILLGFVRMLVGCVPLALYSAPIRGSGKTKLANIASLIQTGGSPLLLSYTNDEDELGKRIYSPLLGGAPVILMDNVSQPIKADELAKTLTCKEYSNRLLGRNDAGATRPVPQLALWQATGNNISLGGDMPRRVYWIRLDPKRADPESRGDFRIPNLDEWVTANRGQLVWACLTLIRSWFAAGQPPAPLCPVVGSFEEWARVMSGILHHAGIGGFYENTQLMNAVADDDTGDWQDFLYATWKRFKEPFLLRDIYVWVEADQGITIPIPVEIAECLKQKNFKRLGHVFKRKVDVIHANGLVLRRAGHDKHSKTAVWQVELADGYTEPPDSPGFAEQKSKY